MKTYEIRWANPSVLLVFPATLLSFHHLIPLLSSRLSPLPFPPALPLSPPAPLWTLLTRDWMSLTFIEQSPGCIDLSWTHRTIAAVDTDMRDTDTRIRMRGYGYADTDTRIRIRICGIRICGYGYADIRLNIYIYKYNIILYYTQVALPCLAAARPRDAQGSRGRLRPPAGRLGSSAPWVASWFRMLPGYFRM